MFENALANIRQKFKSRAPGRLSVHSEKSEKSTNLRDNLQFLKFKFTKTESNLSVPTKESEDLCLSPRAVGFAECARTEIEWPSVPEHHRNILDKFTEIITIADRSGSPRSTRKRNDREEIRRRLAMGTETEEYSTGHERPGRKPSLHSRLQSATAKTRPNSLSTKPSKSRSTQSLGHIPLKESDFYALQATLQTEARMALAQAKEMARIHMERERRCRTASPVTEMLRKSLDKANSPLAPDRRRVSRQLLTDMNVAQLQVIVNSLHGEVEQLSESLVRLLMARDELHMSQDSMLVDIEDLTRYLGVKEQGKKGQGAAANRGGVGGVRRLASLMHK